MSITVRELLVKLGVRADTGPVARFGKAVGHVKGTMGAAAGMAQRLTGGLKGLVAGYLGFQAIEGAIRGIVGANTEFERLHASLQTIEGDVAGADRAFASISNFAATTPFQLQEVTTGFIKLKNMGLDPSDRALNSYGNTASSMGKGLNDMVEAVADAATGEFERLKEFGIKASSEGNKVKFTFQGVTTTVKKNSAEIEKYLIGIGENQFAGAMERQMDTLGGRFSNLKDTLFQTAIAVGKGGLNDAIRDFTKLLIDAASGSNGLAQSIGKTLGDLVRDGAGVLKFLMSRAGVVMGFVQELWGMLRPILPTLLDTIRQITSIGDRLIKGLLPTALGIIQKLLPMALALLSRVLALIDSLAGAVLPVVVRLLDRIAPVALRLLEGVAGLLEHVAQAALPLVIRLIERIAPIIEGMLARVLPIVEEIFNQIRPLLEGIVTLLSDSLGQGIERGVTLLTSLIPIVEMVVQFISDVFSDLGPDIQETFAELLTLAADLVEALMPLILLLVQLVKDNLDNMLPAVRFILRAIMTVVKWLVSSMGNDIRDFAGKIGWVAGIIKAAVDRQVKLWATITAPILSFWDALKEKATSAVSGVREALQPVIEKVEWLLEKLEQLDIKKKVTTAARGAGDLLGVGESGAGSAFFQELAAGGGPGKGKSLNQTNKTTINIQAPPGSDAQQVASLARGATTDAYGDSLREAERAYGYGA